MTLIERLRASAQGISLGAEGMGWAPEKLYEEAARRIEYLQEQLGQIRFTASVAIESEQEDPEHAEA